MRRERSPTVSGTSFAGWYFVTQAFLVGLWWWYLVRHPESLRLFTPPGAAEVDLVAFRWPDLLVLVPASALAGLAVLASSRWALPLAWLAAGAVDYAFGYSVSWSLARQGAWWNVALMAPAAFFSTVAALDASASTAEFFRRARPASRGRHIVATLGQTAVFWVVFLAVVPLAIRSLEQRLGGPTFWFPGQAPVAALLFLACGTLGLASGITMAGRGSGTPLPFVAPNQLVTSGPYAWVRNPMVVAGLGQGLAVGLGLGSWAVVGYVVCGGILWQFLVRPAEERDLAASFGAQYTEYCRRVRCWVPRRRGESH